MGGGSGGSGSTNPAHGTGGRSNQLHCPPPHPCCCGRAPQVARLPASAALAGCAPRQRAWVARHSFSSYRQWSEGAGSVDRHHWGSHLEPTWQARSAEGLQPAGRRSQRSHKPGRRWVPPRPELDRLNSNAALAGRLHVQRERGRPAGGCRLAGTAGGSLGAPRRRAGRPGGCSQREQPQRDHQRRPGRGTAAPAPAGGHRPAGARPAPAAAACCRLSDCRGAAVLLYPACCTHQLDPPPTNRRRSSEVACGGWRRSCVSCAAGWVLPRAQPWARCAARLMWLLQQCGPQAVVAAVSRRCVCCIYCSCIPCALLLNSKLQPFSRPAPPRLPRLPPCFAVHLHPPGGAGAACVGAGSRPVRQPES